MENNYSVINIKAFLDKDNEDTYIGEERLYQMLSDFSCPKNPDVENFLLKDAIEFTKKQQSITYLVFDSYTTDLLGYFALTIKPITIHLTNDFSKTNIKKLQRVSTQNEETNAYTLPAYLIAQLGKNYTLPKELRIDGSLLLDFALDTIRGLQYAIGGILEFLECDDNEFLLNFYKKNHFKEFDTRIAISKYDNKEHLLHQLLKFI